MSVGDWCQQSQAEANYSLFLESSTGYLTVIVRWKYHRTVIGGSG